MKMLDKERRKKKHHQNSSSSLSSSSSTTITSSSTKDDIKTNKIINSNEFDSNNYIIKKEKTDNSNNIQTEIRTDDFVVRLLLFNFSINNSSQFGYQKFKNIFYNIISKTRAYERLFF